MKKTRIIKKAFPFILGSLVLCGCSEASAKIKKDEVLFSVEGTDVTKEEVYEDIKLNDSITYVMDKVKEVIADKEIEDEDTIDKKTAEIFESYVEYYGSEEAILDSIDGTIEEFKENQVSSAAKQTLLKYKYIDKNQKTYLDKYESTVTRILMLESEEEGSKALKELEEGAEWNDVYSKYTTETSYYENKDTTIYLGNGQISDEIVKKVYKTDNPGVLEEVFTTDDTTFYIINVISKDVEDEKYRDMIYDSIINADSELETNMWSYYLKKYNFEIFDQEVFDAFKSTNPEYLWQYPELKKESDL